MRHRRLWRLRGAKVCNESISYPLVDRVERQTEWPELHTSTSCYFPWIQINRVSSARTDLGVELSGVMPIQSTQLRTEHRPVRRGGLAFVDFFLSAVLAAWGRSFFSREVTAALAFIARTKSHRLGLSSNDILHLVEALRVAEDRRFLVHRGVDCRGLARAAFVYVRGGHLQGASTITQQLVRVAINDYRISVIRKLKEMCIACVIDRSIPKCDQAMAYLCVAYFGWRMNGCDAAVRRLGFVQPLNRRQAAEIVARLRFPEPRRANDYLLSRIVSRADYIEALLERGEFE